MAAGVSIPQNKPHPMLASLVLSVTLLTLGVRGVAYPYSSDLVPNDPYENYTCPDQCLCYKMAKQQANSNKSVWLNCTLDVFGPNVRSGILRLTRNQLTSHAHFTCAHEEESFLSPPESALWDRAFSGFSHLRDLAFSRCAFHSIPGTAFEGLHHLDRLIINGASISVLDSDLLTFTPELSSLQVSKSGLTLLSALCRTGFNLRVLNLSGNALPSFDAAGVRCTGRGPNGSLAPPLAGLETLDLRGNTISAWPRWLGESLPGLYYLAVGHNQIANFGSEPFKNLPHLTFLDLTNNSISALDSGFFRGVNSNLKTLSLSRNLVERLPYGLLSQIANLHHLDLSAMNLDSQVWEHLGHLHRLTHLDLSSNRLVNLRQDTLSSLNRLETLYLGHNQVTELPDRAFNTHIFLLTLNISHNHLESIPQGALDGADNLRSLYLDHNNINRIYEDAFTGNTKLETLDLSNNDLSFLPGRFLVLHVDLKTCDISHNKLQELHSSAFSRTLSLVSLNVSHNELPRLPSGPLPRDLEYIDLSFNAISDPVPPSILSGVTKVKDIRLSHNRLTSLPLTMFTSCGALTHLDLSYNSIEQVEVGMFTGAKSLEEINLSNNQIQSIGTAFGEMKKLVVLNLSNNKLTAITHGQFPQHIEHIDLSNNLIESIKDHTFKSLTRIKTVDLRANRLKRINRMAVAISYNIAYSPEFVLRYNPLVCDCHLGWLKDWLTGTLSDMKTLPTFSAANRLSCESPFSQGFTSVAAQERSSFLCEYREFCEKECMCREFKACYCCYRCPEGCKCVRGDGTMNLQRVDCQAARLTEFPQRMPEGATEVRLDGNFLPEIPGMAFRALRYAQVLYLNHSNIQTINNSTFTGLRSLRVLYLQNNFLTEIFEDLFQPLNNLEELHLDNNELVTVQARALLAPPFLRLVTLHKNSLVTFPLDDLWGFVNRSSHAGTDQGIRSRRAAPGGTSLSLRENPWSCESGFACSFLSFLQVNSEAIEDLQHIECIPEPQVVAVIPENGPMLGAGSPANSDPRPAVSKASAGRNILDLQMDVCWTGPARENRTSGNMTGASVDTRTSEKKMYVLIAASVIVILALALLIVVFVNRHLLQVLCYTRFGCRIFSSSGKAADEKSAAGDERPYDAFICHSNKDTEFVLQELAPRLEDGEKQFRLCVHYRDFPVGANLGDAIVRSVKASKKTILVLSENFLESEYCKFEFEAAHQQVLSEKRSRLIILLLGDLDPAKVKDSDLRHYLRTQTYLKVGEKWFWEKLLFAMPNVSTRHSRRRHSGGKSNNNGDLSAAARLPSSRDLEYMDRGRRLSEQQQQLQEIEQQHLFELQQQQQHQLLLQQQQQQLMAQTPLIQYPHESHLPNHIHHQFPHHHHLHHPHHHMHHHHHNSPFSLPNYEEQSPSHPQQLLFNPYPQHHPHHLQQQQQQQQLMMQPKGPAHRDIYEASGLDSPAGSNYHLARNGHQTQAGGEPNFLTPDFGRLPGMGGEHGGQDGEAGEGGASGRESYESMHVNSAFHTSDDSSTSGYHNGSADCCSSCGHYEEVGPGSTSVGNTPSKLPDPRPPPPVPVIPKEGFGPMVINT